jgi:ribosomal protein L9
MRLGIGQLQHRVPVRFLTPRKTRGIPIIVLQEIPEVGLPGDLVAVKPGRARNHFIPKGMAAYATHENLQRYNDIVSRSQHRYVSMKDSAARSAAEQLEEIQRLEKSYNQRYRTALESFIANSRARYSKFSNQ